VSTVTVTQTSRDETVGGYRHEAFLYSGLDEFLSGTMSFIRRALSAGGQFAKAREHFFKAANANIALAPRNQAFGGGEIFCRRHLQIVLAAFDDERSQPRRFGDRGVVGQRATDRSAVRAEDRIEVKALRRLRPP